MGRNPKPPITAGGCWSRFTGFGQVTRLALLFSYPRDLRLASCDEAPPVFEFEASRLFDCSLVACKGWNVSRAAVEPAAVMPAATLDGRR
jgi:hypothetical protein